MMQVLVRFHKGNTIGMDTRFKNGNQMGIRFKKGDKPWNYGLKVIKLHGHDPFLNGRKHCIVCDIYWEKDQYSAFKNPLYCKDCGRKLRTLPRRRRDRVYI